MTAHMSEIIELLKGMDKITALNLLDAVKLEIIESDCLKK